MDFRTCNRRVPNAAVPKSSAFVIGEAGLTTALHEAGYVMTETSPEYVVLGETRSYDFNAITRAIRFIEAGAKFIATNPDVTGPSEEGILPATGSVAAMITKATGKSPYFIGKPNSIMLRAGLNKIGVHSEGTALIGDRMDTDVQAGIEAGLRTHLVLRAPRPRRKSTTSRSAPTRFTTQSRTWLTW